MRSLAEGLLVLTLLQGTSATLTVAVRLDGSGRAATLLTLLWLVAYALSAFLLLRHEGMRRVAWLVRFRLPLLILCGGVLASCLWSIDSRLSAERAVHFIGSTLIGLALGSTLSLTRTLQISRTVLGALMVACALASWQWPAMGIEDYVGRPVWRGLMTSKNTLGFWAAVTALLMILQTLRPASLPERTGWALLSLVSLLCLWQSVSATSVLALLIALLVIGYVWTSARLDLGALASTSLALLGATFAAMAMRSIDTNELIGRSGDLTGRGALWEQTWQLIAQRPWGGFGYGTIWQPTEQSRWIQQSLLDLNWIAYHAHNGLLQVASSVGLPLTLLTIAFALQQLIEIVHSHYRTRLPDALFVLGFCVALLVSNYSEARLLVNRELYWIWFLALPLALLRQGPAARWSAAPVTSVWRRSFGVPGRRLTPTTDLAMRRRRESRQARNALKNRLVADLPPRAARTDARRAPTDRPSNPPEPNPLDPTGPRP